MQHLSIQPHRPPAFGAARHSPQDFAPVTHASARRHPEAAGIRSREHHEPPVGRAIHDPDAWRKQKNAADEQPRFNRHGQLYVANIRSRSGRAKYIEGMKDARSKRKTAHARIPQACNACRLHKRRCSGHLPCELCTKRGRASWCTYEDPEDDDDDDDDDGANGERMDFQQVSSQFIRDSRRRSYTSPPSSPLEPVGDSRMRAPYHSHRKSPRKRRGSVGSSDDSLGGSSDDGDDTAKRYSAGLQSSSEPSSSAMSRQMTLDDAAVASIVQPLRRSPSDGFNSGGRSGMAALSLSATFNKDSSARAGPPRIRAASSGEAGFFRGPLGDPRPRFRFGFLSTARSPQNDERAVLAGPPPTSLGLSKITWTYGRKLPTPLPLSSPVPPTTPRSGAARGCASATAPARRGEQGDDLMSPPLPVDPELVSCVLVDSSGRPRPSRQDLESCSPGLFKTTLEDTKPKEAERPLTAPISSSLSTFLPALQDARPASAGKDVAGELEVLRDDVAATAASSPRAGRSPTTTRVSNLSAQSSGAASPSFSAARRGGATPRLHVDTSARSAQASSAVEPCPPPLPSMRHLLSSHEQAIASAQYEVLCRGQGIHSASAAVKAPPPLPPDESAMPAPSHYQTKDSRRTSLGVRRSHSLMGPYVPSQQQQPTLQPVMLSLQHHQPQQQLQHQQQQQRQQHEAMLAWHEERRAHQPNTANRLRNHSQPVRPSDAAALSGSPPSASPQTSAPSSSSPPHAQPVSPLKRKLDGSASDGARLSPSKAHPSSAAAALHGAGSPKQPTMMSLARPARSEMVPSARTPVFKPLVACDERVHLHSHGGRTSPSCARPQRQPAQSGDVAAQKNARTHP